MSEPTASPGVGAVPDRPEDVGDVFQAHHSYYRDKAGEVAHQQQSGETQIQREYSGRVVFELLQNALDRAESAVGVHLRKTDDDAGEYTLIVTNNGEAIRVNPSYRYDSPPDAGIGGRRPDFNALCSVSTSNKSPDESIGTKGIGFRSVFSLGTHVRVWSRFAEHPGWWGLEMHSPFDREIWETRRTEPAIKRGCREFLEEAAPPIDDGESRPSYHFPIPLSAPGLPSEIGDEDALSTAVLIPVSGAQTETLRRSIAEFKAKHLYFVGLDPGNRNITVTFETPNETFTRRTWPPSERPAKDEQPWLIADYASPDLAARARAADHDISEPGAAVAWPPEELLTQRADSESGEATVYGYLPTLIEAPFLIDIQGDFQLSIDRTNIRFDDDQIGEYNESLLEIAAELHLLQFLRAVDEKLVSAVEWDAIQPSAVSPTHSLEAAIPRTDLWRFLNPSYGESPAARRIVTHVRSLLFPGDGQDASTYDLWSRLADRYFAAGDEWPIATYEHFWATSTGWIDWICSTKTRQTNWRRTALAMCDALREQEAAVAPITVDSNPDGARAVPAVPLPERGDAPGSGGESRRHERKLFLRDSDDASLSLPAAMANAGRAVTAFDFASDLHSGTPNALGTTAFNRWEVLRELRQLPNSLTDWSPAPLVDDDTRAVEQQRELISFAAALYLLETDTSYATPSDLGAAGPGWRVLSTPSEAARRAGRSVATLYLPTTDGGWLPARQLTRDRVAVDRLGELPERLPLDEFLAFLGVAPTPPTDGVPLTLVEGGEEGGKVGGVVDPVDVPPKLTAPGGGRLMDLTLGTLPTEPCGRPDAWRRSLVAAEDWLQPVFDAERAAIEGEAEDAFDRINLLTPLGNRAWYPVDVDVDGTGASPPSWAANEAAIAPRELTLLTAQQPALRQILWSVERTSADETLLTTLGAITGTDRKLLATADADPAFRLLDQLRRPDPNTFDDSPRVHDEFVQLFERVLEGIVRGDGGHDRVREVAVLIYTGDPDGEPLALPDRRLEWRTLGELSDDRAWLPERNTDRGHMRRLFSEEPLIAGTIGSGLLGEYPTLTDCSARVTPAVRSEPLKTSEEDGVDPTIHAEGIADALSEVVPKLLALAGADQEITVSLTDQAERWGPGLFEPVENVWREFTAALGSDLVRTEIEYAYDDETALLYTAGSSDQPDETSVIRFDIGVDGKRPPLEAFGRPLAELLLIEDTSQAASLFERALQAHESNPDAIERLLERRDAYPLVRNYEQRINPLDNAAREELLQKTDRALGELGLGLKASAITRLRALRPDDIEIKTRETVTSTEVNDLFAKIELSEEQEPFRLLCRIARRQGDDWVIAVESEETDRCGIRIPSPHP